MSKDIDVCAVTETWLKENEILDKKQIAPIGYSVISHPRRDNRVGGGIVMVYKDNIKVRSVLNGSCGTMQYVLFSFKVQESLINLFIIYQFPNTSVFTFCNDLADVLEGSILNLTGYISLVGDFNIHVDQVHNLDSITFSDFLDSFGLSNKVQFLTHKHQHTLDLVVSSCTDGFIQSVFGGHLLSDHNFVHWKLRVGKEDRVLIKTTQSTKDFNHSRFSWRACDELQDNVVNTGKRDLGSLVDAYNRTLTNIMDDLAPEKTKALKVNCRQLWFNDKILQELKLRKMEREGMETRSN